MIIFFVFIGVLLFVLGVTFLFKGYTAIPPIDTVVPKKDFEGLKTDLETSKGEGNNLKKQLDTLTIELVQTKSKLQDSMKAQDAVKELQAQDEQNKTKIHDLDDRLGVFMAKAEEQAKEASAVINTLTQEKEGLQKKVEEAKALDPQVLEEMKTQKENLEKNLAEQIAKIQQLETDVAASKKLQEELASVKSTIDNLTKENQKLKDDITTAASVVAKPVETQNTLELTQTKEALEQAQGQMESQQAQSSQKETRIQDLEKKLQGQSTGAPSEAAPRQQMEKELTRMHREGEEHLANASAKIENLQFENQDLLKKVRGMELDILRLGGDFGRLRQEKERDDASRSLDRDLEFKRLCNDLKLQIDAMTRTIDELRNENKALLDRQRHFEQGIPSAREMTAKQLLADMQRMEINPADYESWSQEKKQMEQHLRQLKDFNTHLLEKERMIQMELTKSRTQAKGLEKICEEFKRQLEKTNRS